MRDGVLVTIAALSLYVLQGCASSRQIAAVQVPAHAVSDEVVVPPELEDDINRLEDWDYLTQLWNPALAPSFSLEERRAFTYTWFNEFKPSRYVEMDSFVVQTLIGEEHQYDRVVSEIAERIGFTVVSGHFNWDEIQDDFGTSEYVFRTSLALSPGELVWFADWIVTNYAGQIHYVESITYLSH